MWNWDRYGDCSVCEGAKDVLKGAAPVVMAWVMAVARKAAEDAVNAARAKLAGEE